MELKNLKNVGMMNDIFFILIMTLTIYYFSNLEDYCISQNASCLTDPKRKLIINTSIILLIFSLLTYFSRMSYKKGMKINKSMKVLLFITLISILGVSLYRMINVFNYIKQLKDECNCKEYTLEYYIIKYHNYFQLITFISLLIILFTLPFLTMYFVKRKNK